MLKRSLPDPAKDADDEINLTPMLDVVFIMLIFFIVTASFIKETGIEISRPSGPAADVDENTAILITISDNNDIWIEGRLIDPRAVRANIERLRVEKPGEPVVVQADKRSHNNTLVQVMNSSREAGIYNVLIADNAGGEKR